MPAEDFRDHSFDDLGEPVARAVGDHQHGLVRHVLEPRALDRGYFEPAYIRDAVDGHLSGRTNVRRLLWSLLCFEWWHRAFIDGEPLPELARSR